MTINGPFKELKEDISSGLVDTTRTAGRIANEDLAFHRSTNPSVVHLLEQQSARLLQLARRLTWTATKGSEVSAPQISDADSVEDNWKGIVDVFDNLLEKADACLDEYTGVIRRLSPDREGEIKKASAPFGKSRPDKAYRTQNIAKPQLLFEQVPTNDESTPFKPLLRSKPHAITPLEDCLTLVPSEDGSTRYALDSYSSRVLAANFFPALINHPFRYQHPYETEIKQARYPAATFARSEPIPYLPYEDTTATFVDTPEAVASMLQELKLAKEIAIDLEHHDEHSYIGLVSLMQISTRGKDWIVDTLKPWRRELQILNQVFADPNIIKVFHGACMDMIWLQRDLGLYVVGLFDTYHASRALGYPKHGLAYLLKRFVDFDAAKQYQMADWRIRPLPEEMFNYARSDTHFLLYAYDNLRNELIEKSGSSQPEGDIIEVVMNKSKEESLQRYESPRYDVQGGAGAMGWFTMLYRTPALFNREQFAVFRAVHQWRDALARQEDESVHVVMPKHVLFNIAREVPMDMPSLLGCSHPMSKIFQKRKKDLLEIIKHAKSVGPTGPEMKNLMSVGQFDSNDHVVKANEVKRTQISTNVGTADRAVEQSSRSDSMARAKVSHFWGPTVFVDVSSPMPKVQLNDDKLQLALPMPELTAEVFEDHKATGKIAALMAHVDAGTRAEHQYARDKKTKEDDIFIVKQLGGSGKRKAVHLENASEPVSTEEDDKVLRASHIEAKVEQHQSVDAKPCRTKEDKQQRKLERKRQKAIGSAEKEGSKEVEPFDYASAPSVLHAKHNVNGRTEGVNPYTKASDAPKGMRKLQKEVAGKSFTFNS